MENNYSANNHSRLEQKLFRPVDNSGIIVLRIIFGFLIFLESGGAIATGWVKETFVEPAFTFTFIDFDWLHPLPGNGMYFYYGVMAIFGLGVMLGLFYRFSISMFTVMWTITYLMQKSHYNNHYYLLILLCSLMILLPANRYFSLDVKRNQKLQSLTCPQWCYWILILQIGIVFTYASIAKMYPDWINGVPVKLWFNSKSSMAIIGPLLKQAWLIPLVVWGGIFFDLLITPLLLWNKTRWIGFICSVFFHGFNSAVFHIGIFPYLMIGLTVLFFPPEFVRKQFLKRKPSVDDSEELSISLPKHHKIWLFIIGIYFLFQIGLPLRHHLFEDNVLWTEEGHRMSWRMMLRSKSGVINFNVKPVGEEKTIRIDPYTILSRNQARKLGARPDMIWQTVQFLKVKYKNDKGYPSIYVDAKVSLNGRPMVQYIDNTVDLAKVPWEKFKHSDWILPFPGY